MPKKTATPKSADVEVPAAQNGAVWDDQAKAAHYAEVAVLVGTAMKTIPIAQPGAVEMLRWLKKNSKAGYKNLLRAAFQAAGI